MNIKLIKIDNPSAEDSRPITDAISQYGLSEVGGIEPVNKTIHLKLGTQIIGGATGKIHFGKFYLDQIWVNEKYRNQGYGTKIHALALEIARENGCKSICLQTLNEKAVKLYLRLGYKTVAQVEDYVKGFNLYHMLMPL